MFAVSVANSSIRTHSDRYATAIGMNVPAGHLCHSGIQMGPNQKPHALKRGSNTGFTHWPL